jgi:hypothetical protein
MLGFTADGARVAFGTLARLVPTDNDDQYDVYLRENGSVTLISTGPAGGNARASSSPARIRSFLRTRTATPVPTPRISSRGGATTSMSTRVGR